MKKQEYLGDGRCLYCLNRFDNAELTDEHIIPTAIHGALLIKNGACVTCARSTNKNFENQALNQDLLLPRLLLELKGRGKSGAPQDLRHLPAVYSGDTTMGNDGVRLLDFPISLYPKMFHLIQFPPAGVLSGTDRGDGIANFRLRFFDAGGPRLRSATVKSAHTNGPFAMMIAKIAYCYAVAKVSLDGFDGTAIRDVISEKRKDVYNFVGSTKKPVPLTNREIHSLHLRRQKGYLIVLVNLFASMAKRGEPVHPYEVVVGT
ncbi:HNH endonuclease [Sphingobium sp. SCG-1]|uniref:HNH endonuclease n=1 Tax=Sphingobium sp. SCG-1 TaxID=2072936 RepID=UPI001CB959B0|nr:HNH endonuclease [Sphingobium sp. SCG-1]